MNYWLAYAIHLSYYSNLQTVLTEADTDYFFYSASTVSSVGFCKAQGSKSDQYVSQRRVKQECQCSMQPKFLMPSPVHFEEGRLETVALSPVDHRRIAVVCRHASKNAELEAVS